MPLGAMSGLSPRLALAAAILVTVLGGESLAASDVSYVKVTGLPVGRVVWVRSKPGMSAKRVGFLPATARHIRSYGCSRFVTSGWCQIRYRGTRGWVSKRYLRPDLARRA